MGRLTRFTLILLGILLVLVVLAGVSLTVFLNGAGLRTRVELTLTKALARQVTIGKLNLSLWRGTLLAEQMTIADDTRFGAQPFVQADAVKMGVEVLPLLLRRQVRINGFVFRSPAVQLLRAADGSWNYSSLGARGSSEHPSRARTKTERKLPDLAVSSIEVDDARITVGVEGETRGSLRTENRVYEHVDLSVKNFGLTRSFPFQIAANLPGNGAIRVSGTAGPINRQDASATPFTAHLEANHVDLERSGLVGSSSGVSCLLGHVTLDLVWTEHLFHVSKLRVDSPRLEIASLHNAANSRPAHRGSGSVWRTLLSHLSVDEAEVKIGTLTVVREGRPPALYRQIDAHITNWGQDAWSPFEVRAVLPGSGDIHANGRARLSSADSSLPSSPFDLETRISVNHLDLATSGFLPPHSAIDGSTDLRAQLRWNGETMAVAGTARIAGIKLARNGRPSAKPVEVRFSIAQKENAQKRETIGDIQHAAFSMGAATINLAGDYRLGKAAALHLKIEGDALPIDEIESFLPALGVQLPEGSRLAGGTLTTSLTVAGPEPDLTINGPVRLENTQLMGFDLGSKLTSLSKFTDGRIGSATGPGTTIRSLSLELHVGGSEIQTDKVAVNIAGLGTATGAGTISDGGVLHYKLLLKFSELVSAPGGAAGLARSLAAQLPDAWAGRALGAINWLVKGPWKNGVPILIGGTAHHPTFTPDLGALMAPKKTRR